MVQGVCGSIQVETTKVGMVILHQELLMLVHNMKDFMSLIQSMLITITLAPMIIAC